MIQLKLCGRAGNQFFQYATVYNYIKKNNIDEKIYISIQENERKKTDNYSFGNILDKFNICDYVSIDKVNMDIHQYILDFFYRMTVKIFRIYRKIKKDKMKEKDYEIIDKLWHKRLNTNGLYYYMPTNKKFYKSKNDKIIFYGAFENKGYFDESKKEIMNMFTPINEKKKENERLYNVIKRTDSVCVTIRRGDFLMDKFKKNYYICTPKYFETAIKKIENMIRNPQFIIFSDDVEWCKNNMRFPENTLYESGKDEIWEKIRLMYSCKHFIISNSTFSWWAQYLSRNEEKIVIAPNKWNGFEYSDNIYDKKWILID